MESAYIKEYSTTQSLEKEVRFLRGSQREENEDGS